VPYEPPPGWLERIDEPTDDTTAVRARFHLTRDCVRIRNPEGLVGVDRPYSAPRCPACAPV
jgi:hypothetical protein